MGFTLSHIRIKLIDEKIQSKTDRLKLKNLEDFRSFMGQSPR